MSDDTKQTASVNPDTETSNPVDSGNPDPKVTVKDSLALLRRIAEFNNKKEDVLKRISELSSRIDKRLEGISPFSPEAMPKDPSSAHTANVPELPTKVMYTRIRETPKPGWIGNCISMSLPLIKAVDDDWKTLACKVDGRSVAGEGPTYTDDAIVLPSGGVMSIATGVKLGLPPTMGVRLTSFSGLTIIAPQLVTGHTNDKELMITVRNDCKEAVKLVYGVPLFAGYLVRLTTNVLCNEMLNSTYEDWVRGTING